MSDAQEGAREWTKAWPQERKRMMLTTPPWPERRDDTIPLAGEKMSREAIQQYANPLIQRRLRVLAREGWEADGVTDALALWRQGRLACREHSSFWLDTRTYTPVSVTVRVHRVSTE